MTDFDQADFDRFRADPKIQALVDDILDRLPGRARDRATSSAR